MKIDDNKVLLSIIIPIFNPQFSLFCKCIDSFCGITVKHEIILVDDGSKISIDKCIEYTKDKKNFIWLRKSNNGVSSARNAGIDVSKGKFLLFVDVDDAITGALVDYINEKLPSTNDDWILFDVLVKDKVTNKTHVKKLFRYSSETLLAKDEVLWARASSSNLSECWGKLIKRDILVQNTILFPVGVNTGEDVYFNTALMGKADTIRYEPTIGYNYLYEFHFDKRLLADPYERYEKLSIRFNQIYALVKSSIPGVQKNRYIEKICSLICTVIVQDALILAKHNKLDYKMRQYIYSFIEDNQVLDNISLSSFCSIKEKVYYISIKYKLWLIIKLLSFFK